MPDTPRRGTASFHDALHALDDGAIGDAQLTIVARRVASDARQQGLGAPRMLVLLKHEWVESPLAARAAPEGRALLNRLVTLAIRAYYSPTASA